ncbi:MAG: AbrB/MazE/SpoVT family DNA-binding domain-containing protein [Azoarcus sp.]|jgi:antitoxin MazE|nr:AbrB/MazE/SpoVT family DNA-binding domain-containing protein [Azoarcus sp.]
MRIAKWGNSLAVRLPVALIRALDLHEGEDVEVIVKKKNDDEAIDAALRKIRAEINLPADFRFNREGANARR